MKLLAHLFFFLSILLLATFTHAQESIILPPEKAQLKGGWIQEMNGIRNIGYFNTPGHEATWSFDVSESGAYFVELDFAISEEDKGGSFEIKGGRVPLISSFVLKDVVTGERWDSFIKKIEGKLCLQKGTNTFSVKVLKNKGINIRSIRLIPMPNKYLLSSEVISLFPKDAQLNGAALESHWGISNVGQLDRKEKSAQWEIDVPFSGNYIVDLYFSVGAINCPNIKISSGKSIFRWKTTHTGGWGKFIRKHIGSINLDKGKQNFRISTEEDTGINVAQIRLIPFPGLFVSPAEDGSVMLLPDTANLIGSSSYGFKTICDLGFNDTKVSWNIILKSKQRYKIVIEYSSAFGRNRREYRINNELNFLDFSLPSTGDWNVFEKATLRSIFMPSGKSTLTLQNRNNEFLDVRSIKLIPEDSSISQSEDPFQLPVPKICFPNKYGIIECCIEKAKLSHLDLFQRAEDFFMSANWSHDDSWAIWKVNLPEAGRYALELSWANDDPRRTLEVYLNSQMTFNWKIERTGFWGGSARASSKIIGELSLPAGESELKLYVPNAKDGGSLDCRGIRLIPVKDMLEKEGLLRKRPRLGMNLYELELLWGKSVPRKDTLIERRGDQSDTDWNLYDGIAKQTESRQWFINQMPITAVFFKNVCISLDINRSTKEMMDIASALIPNVSWNYVKGEKLPQTVYSKDKNYKLQAWKNEWGVDYFEIKASGLLQSLRADELNKLRQLRKRPRLGMTEEELIYLWGNPAGKEWPEGGIQRRGDKNDVDWFLYEQIKSQCSVRRWTLTEEGNLRIHAYFWENRCVGLDIHSNGRILAPTEILTLVQSFVPGVRFVDLPVKRGIPFTVYSSNYGNGYKLQNWGEYVEIKASGLIKEMQLKRISQLKKSVKRISNILRTSDMLNDKTLFGITWPAMDRILGKSEMSGTWWCGKPTRGWKFPQSDIVLIGSFGRDERGEVLYNITIVGDNQQLSPEVALSLAKELIAPYQLGNVSKEQMKSWFTLRSTDQDKRFILEWYHDGYSGASLRITDDLPRQKQEEKQKKKNLNEIKAVL